MQFRLGCLLVVAACRFHFDDRTPDAAPDAPPQALACNTPVRLGDASATTPKLSAAATRTRIRAAWIDDAQELAGGGALMPAPDQAFGFIDSPETGGAYSVVSLAATPDVLLAAYVIDTSGAVRLVDDATSTFLTAPVLTPIQILGARGAAATGNASDPLFVIAGNNTTTVRAEIAGVNGDGTISPSVDSGNVNGRTSLVNVGNRIAIIDIVTKNCEVKTADLTVTSRTSTVGWGTNGSCTQGILGYSPGRADALVIRHDVTDNDLNHTIATRSGMNYVIAPENRLRNPGNEARVVGVADGYWVAYETAGTLEAVHVDFVAGVGTPVVLGPVSTATGHDIVVKDGVAYAIWLGDGLELARLCE